MLIGLPYFKFQGQGIQHLFSRNSQFSGFLASGFLRSWGLPSALGGFRFVRLFIVFIRVFLVVHVQGLFFGVLGFDDSVKSNFILLI